MKTIDIPKKDLENYLLVLIKLATAKTKDEQHQIILENSKLLEEMEVKLAGLQELTWQLFPQIKDKK